MTSPYPMTPTGRHESKPIHELTFDIVPDVGRWVKTANLKVGKLIGRACWRCHRAWGVT